MHSRVDQWLDTVSSPRYPSDQKDNAINTAIETIVNDRYYSLNPKERENSFQSSQRLRDELYTILAVELIPSNGPYIPISDSLNYRFLVHLKVKIDGIWYQSFPVTYDEIEILDNDPFRRPTLDYPSQVYRIEELTRIRIIWGMSSDLQYGRLYYLKNPQRVSLSGLTDSDLPINMHEEICKMASDILKAQSVNLAKKQQ